MANEDPDGIPEQIRQNRPFMAVLALAFLIAIGTFLFILSRDPGERDIERNVIVPDVATTPAPAPAASTAPATTTEPAAPAPAASGTAAPTATPAPATSPAAPASN